MRKIILGLFVLFVSSTLCGQTIQDVIYLKNGTVVRGLIVEQIIGQSVKLKEASGNINVYQLANIDRFDKEPSSTEIYTTQTVTTPTNIGKKIKCAIDLTAGYVFSWLSGFNDATGLEGSFKSAYQAGIGITIPFNNKWGIETGAYYLLDAGNNFSSDESKIYAGKVNLDYVNIPLLVRYDFMKSQNLKALLSFGMKTGIQYGINTRATYSAGGNSADLEAKNNIDWVIGIYSNIGHSGVALNFNYGFTDVERGADPEFKNYRNKGIAVLYSYRF